MTKESYCEKYTLGNSFQKEEMAIALVKETVFINSFFEDIPEEVQIAIGIFLLEKEMGWAFLCYLGGVKAHVTRWGTIILTLSGNDLATVTEVVDTITCIGNKLTLKPNP